MAVVKNIDVALRANVDKFEAGMRRGTEITRKFTDHITTVAAGVVGFQTALNLGSRAVHELMESMEEIDKANKAAVSIGIATGELIKLRFAVEEVAGDAVDLDRALIEMNKSIAEAGLGGKKAAEAINRLGINFKTLSEASPDKAFQMITEAISGLQTQGEKTIVAMEIFGKQGKQMGVLFENSAKALKDASEFAETFGLNISELDAEKVNQVNDALDRMKIIFKGIKFAIISDLVNAFRALEQLTSGVNINLNEIVKKIKLLIPRGQFGGLSDMGRMIAEHEQRMKTPVVPATPVDEGMKQIEDRAQKAADNLMRAQQAFADPRVLDRLEGEVRAASQRRSPANRATDLDKDQLAIQKKMEGHLNAIRRGQAPQVRRAPL